LQEYREDPVNNTTLKPIIMDYIDNCGLTEDIPFYEEAGTVTASASVSVAGEAEGEEEGGVRLVVTAENVAEVSDDVFQDYASRMYMYLQVGFGVF
jgi:hypothetical protein